MVIELTEAEVALLRILVTDQLVVTRSAAAVDDPPHSTRAAVRVQEQEALLRKLYLPQETPQ